MQNKYQKKLQSVINPNARFSTIFVRSMQGNLKLIILTNWINCIVCNICIWLRFALVCFKHIYLITIGKQFTNIPPSCFALVCFGYSTCDAICLPTLFICFSASLEIEHDMGDIPDNNVHGANMGPTWVLSAQDGPHVGPMNLAIRDWIHGCQVRTISTQAMTPELVKYFQQSPCH